jgi:hypothetical protein
MVSDIYRDLRDLARERDKISHFILPARFWDLHASGTVHPHPLVSVSLIGPSITNGFNIDV